MAAMVMRVRSFMMTSVRLAPGGRRGGDAGMVRRAAFPCPGTAFTAVSLLGGRISRTGGKRSPLRWIPGFVHRYPIATTTRAQLSAWSPRRYPAWAGAAALVITAAGVIVTLAA